MGANTSLNRPSRAHTLPTDHLYKTKGVYTNQKTFPLDETVIEHHSRKLTDISDESDSPQASLTETMASLKKSTGHQHHEKTEFEKSLDLENTVMGCIKAIDVEFVERHVTHHYTEKKYQKGFYKLMRQYPKVRSVEVPLLIGCTQKELSQFTLLSHKTYVVKHTEGEKVVLLAELATDVNTYKEKVENLHKNYVFFKELYPNKNIVLVLLFGQMQQELDDGKLLYSKVQQEINTRSGLSSAPFYIFHIHEQLGEEDSFCEALDTKEDESQTLTEEDHGQEKESQTSLCEPEKLEEEISQLKENSKNQQELIGFYKSQNLLLVDKAKSYEERFQVLEKSLNNVSQEGAFLKGKLILIKELEAQNVELLGKLKLVSEERFTLREDLSKAKEQIQKAEAARIEKEKANPTLSKKSRFIESDFGLLYL